MFYRPTVGLRTSGLSRFQIGLHHLPTGDGTTSFVKPCFVMILQTSQVRNKISASISLLLVTSTDKIDGNTLLDVLTRMT